LGQGRENAKNYLRENPDMASEIEAGIREDAGLEQVNIDDGDFDGDKPQLDLNETEKNDGD
jgi:recombination protein RecA